MTAEAELQALLIQAQDALEHGDAKKAQSLVTRILKAAPRDRDGWMLQAVLHISRDEHGKAVHALDEAIKHHPDDVTLLASKASFLLDHHDDAEGALPLLERATGMLEADGGLDDADADPELKVMAEEAFLLLSECRAMLQDHPGSLAAAERAVALSPHNPEAHVMLGTALLDANRMDDALKSAAAALKADPQLADAHWLKARAHWMRGAQADADRQVDLAVKLDATRFYKPLHADKETIIRLHKQALSELPATVGGPLSRVPISVEDSPRPTHLAWRDPAPSATLLGMHEGTPITLTPQDNPLDNLPPRIVLFRRNLEWMVTSQRELKELIIGTVMHEVAQYQGVELGALDGALAT